MSVLWYCCGCNFGPHNSSLYDECIQCGKVRCARCIDEDPNETPQKSSTQETTRQTPNYSTGRSKKLQRQTTQAKSPNDTVSSSRNTSIPKRLLRELKPTPQSPHQQESSTSPGALPNNPKDDIQSQPFSAPPASTSYIIYSSSLGSLLVDWVYEQSSSGVYSSNEVRALEGVLIELKNAQPGFISVKTEDELSFWNNLKGKVETIIGLLDWSPFQPYMAPLAQDQVRLLWECPCGDTRWAAVPRSFGLKIENTYRTNAAEATQKNMSGNGSSVPEIGTSSQLSGVRARTHTGEPVPESGLPRSTVECQSSESPQNAGSQLHAFLVLLNSSIFGSAHYLVQTSVYNMSDLDFFAWIRNSYYSNRGFLAIWFGLYRYSHCEFFRFRRFDGYEYAPLLPEYPDEDQPSYHFAPKPMRPRPPMASHEFDHWFYKESWSRAARRLLSTDRHPTDRHRRKNKRMRFFLGSRSVVEEKIPKRETALEEGVPASEDFWGLYVVEKHSAFRLAIYSLAFMSPSVYFFFAWLFQWGHGGDLQNASIPIALSLAPLATFWGFVLSTLPRFDNPRRL